MAAQVTRRRDRTWSPWLIVLACLAFVADEATKALAWHLMPVFPYSSGVWLIRPVLFLQHREHALWYGAEDAVKVVLCPIPVVVLARLYPRSPASKLNRLFAAIVALFLAGVSANALDRLSHGSVTDFIGLRLPGGVAFTNLADLYLFAGYVLLPLLGLVLLGRALRSKSSRHQRAQHRRLWLAVCGAALAGLAAAGGLALTHHAGAATPVAQLRWSVETANGKAAPPPTATLAAGDYTIRTTIAECRLTGFYLWDTADFNVQPPGLLELTPSNSYAPQTIPPRQSLARTTHLHLDKPTTISVFTENHNSDINLWACTVDVDIARG